MSKEQLVNNFRNKYGLSGLHAKPTEYMDYEDKTSEVEKDFIKAIDQTREETIREIEDGLPKEMEAFYTGNLMTDVLENDEKKGFNKCLREIKQSLINLRKKK